MYRRAPATQADPLVNSAPSDDVQCLSWSPAANYLVAGAWDNSVRRPRASRNLSSPPYLPRISPLTTALHQVSCWEVAENGSSEPRAATQMEGPVLDTAWSDDGSKVFCAGADTTAKLWDLESSSLTTVAQVCRQQHSPPVSPPRKTSAFPGSSSTVLMQARCRQGWSKTSSRRAPPARFAA